MPPKKNDSCALNHHPDYSAELPRLNRIAGQVEGVKRMIGEGRYCPDILAQLRAIRAASHAIEANILEAHINACITTALTSGSAKDRDKKIAELKALYRRFDD